MHIIGSHSHVGSGPANEASIAEMMAETFAEILVGIGTEAPTFKAAPTFNACGSRAAARFTGPTTLLRVSATGQVLSSGAGPPHCSQHFVAMLLAQWQDAGQL